MVDWCCSVPTKFGVLAPTAALKSTREEPRHRLADRTVQCGGNRECAGRVHGGPLPGSPSSAHSGSCGVVEPAARRPPPSFVRGLSGVGLTSHHRTFADPSPSDATHPTCLSALPTTPVYRSRACRGATVGPSVADLCTLGDLPTCGIFVSCVPPVVP